MRCCKASSRALAVALASVAALACGCAPESSDPVTGSAAGSWDCEIFLPGSNPPNTGDGAVTVTLEGDARVLAQSAAAFAVDGTGAQTLDPDGAIYFAVQVSQYVSETELEIFEVRVLPADWVEGATIPFDGDRAVGFFGTVTFDANGTAIDATIRASTTGGELTLTAAGREVLEPVSGTLAAVQLAAD